MKQNKGSTSKRTLAEQIHSTLATIILICLLPGCIVVLFVNNGYGKGNKTISLILQLLEILGFIVLLAYFIMSILVPMVIKRKEKKQNR
jgi:amino acid transporter